MAATEILSVGSSAAASADIVIAPGSTAILCLKGMVSGSVCGIVEVKDDLGGWQSCGTLSIAPLVYSPGTYRVRRQAGDVFGVFRAG